MSVKTEATSTNHTTWLEFDGEHTEEVWPCRCGETHRGDYGFYDWVHHICYHNEELLLNTPFINQHDKLVAQVLCPLCGEAWRGEGDEEIQRATEV